MIKLKRVPALGTVHLKNAISPANSIHQRPRINISAPRDQFQRIQIIAEQRRWLLATICHYSPLFITIRTIRTIRYSLFATIRCSLFVTIRYSGFPDTLSKGMLFHSFVPLAWKVRPLPFLCYRIGTLSYIFHSDWFWCVGLSSSLEVPLYSLDKHLHLWCA